MNIKFCVVVVAVGIAAFFAGRLTSKSAANAPVLVADLRPANSDVSSSSGSTRSENSSAAVGEIMVSADNGTSKSSSQEQNHAVDPKNQACSLTRRDFYEWEKANESKLALFHERDTQFGSKTKLAPADWDRVLDVEKIEGKMHFRFESALSATIEIHPKEKTIRTSFLYRTATSPDGESMSFSSTFENGRDVGFAKDGSGFYLVLKNSITEPEWIDYSDFAIFFPFDWSGRAQQTVDVYGLTEDLKWGVVGTATLHPARGKKTSAK